MSTPTIEQRVEAQDYAKSWAMYPPHLHETMSHLLTADELRRVLTERDTAEKNELQLRNQILCEHDKINELERQRDQWREVAIALEASLHDGRHNFDDSAQKRFDALAREEKQ